MPRPPRDTAPGIFHVTTHSVWSSVLFRDDIDRMSLLTELAATAAKFDWTCIAVCLMTTHYHLLLETVDESLPIGMKHLNLRHATRFNARHKLRGHVVDGRYWSRRISTDAQLLTAFRYLARNALEAGIGTVPGDWPWCSYRALIEPAESFTFVDCSPVAACWSPAETAIEQLRRFVESPW
jgi:putative transposase